MDSVMNKKVFGKYLVVAHFYAFYYYIFLMKNLIIDPWNNETTG
jgi:hypothetical protein